MSESSLYLLAGIVISASLTFVLRAFPFALMRVAKRYDGIFRFLGQVMPPGMMVILALYAALSLKWSQPAQGSISALALLLVVLVEHRTRQPLLSIGVGLAVYVAGQSVLA
ncbi:AzlD domain-containing protein [Suttonella sp. R2A3]|uniref:AzlD domain-containing protein n=1 Tax=Suttonella sp. R2A3 TaxID=2908648 RepID=UPI001F260901|nr:AzlD domain-containing protein [Suttonella sp. R2A3]UJF25055.1 AzlD domain-containing protein [Suttonella sp. R2A3]